jgi:NAD(P) transhydrogenase subunit beta
MPESLPTIGYLIAAILFILALGGLSKPTTARRGNIFGIVGMALAMGMTVAVTEGVAWSWSIGAIGVGAVLGAVAALRVGMTSMPQMVAIFNSFVGLAAVFLGFATFLEPDATMTGAAHTIHMIEIYLGVAVGALTFTGSVVAWGKLGGQITSEALRLPGRHISNAAMAVGVVAFGVFFTAETTMAPLTALLVNAALASVLGVHLVMAIGGADMPVIVSLLNSYSGWAAAATGFMFSNDLLIITGALVGSSGAILSYIMCRGMNRSLINVIFGGFDTGGGAGSGSTDQPTGEARPADADAVAGLLAPADSVAIVPGYGMAVAQAQHAVSRLTKKLRKAGKTVRFGIHPVAGRMPGHMNVLLAEADVPYDLVFEMEEINESFPETDVVLVVGANDIVNPDAASDSSSPIYGMPQLEVWNASTVVVLKRSLSAGYAGVPNPLFYRDNTRMFFGDAEESLNELLDVL